MITLRQHIDVMNTINKGGKPIDYADTLKPLDKLQFIKDSIETYPLNEKMKNPDSIALKRKIHGKVEDLVLGQFIMLEQIITGKTKLPDHLIDLEICKLIIRPLHHDVFDNEDTEDEKENQEYILDSDVREVYYLLNEFVENRNKTLFEDFAGVFYEPPEDDEDADEVDVENKNSQMLFNQQWYWYSIVRKLGNEDITKYNEIYMLPMPTVLPEMSFLAQKSKIEAAEQRQAQAVRNL